MKRWAVLASAAMVAGGLYAACGDVPQTSACTLVYDFKASLKMTVGKSYSGGCEDTCYRKISTVKVKGYLYACDCCATNLEGILWFGKGWWADGEGDTAYQVDVFFPLLNIIGKKNREAEGALFLSDFGSIFTSNQVDQVEGPPFSFVLLGAGFGKAKDWQVRSLSGAMIGIVEPPACAVDCADYADAVAYPACEFEPDPDIYDVASGKWSIRYNSSLAKKVAERSERQVLADKLPSAIRYVQVYGMSMTLNEWIFGSSNTL